MTAGTAALPSHGGAGLAPDPTRRERLSQTWRGFLTAAKLGWQAEVNWTDPLLFFVYSIAKPVSGALILVFMLEVISGGTANPAFRAFVVIGSALWAFVVAGISGLAWTVLDDRERYRMLKYLYVSPNDLLVLLLGRGLARMSVGGIGAVVTLALGISVLGVPFDPARVDWLILVVAMILGLTSIIALGTILAGVALQTRQDAWQYPEAVSGALFLVVGAVFPLIVLPTIGQAAGLLMPLTWWLEAVRGALFPDIVSGIGGPGSLFAQLTGRSAPGPTEATLVLLATTAVVTLAAVVTYRWSERRAKERGLFDVTTGS